MKGNKMVYGWRGKTQMNVFYLLRGDSFDTSKTVVGASSMAYNSLKREVIGVRLVRRCE